MMLSRVRFTIRRMIIAVGVLIVIVVYTAIIMTSTIKLVNSQKNQLRQSGHPQQIPASEIGNRVQILGDLGKPIGEMMTVRGHWSEPDPKGGQRDFVVTVVDGNSLNPPVIFGWHDFHYLGDRYRGTQAKDPLDRISTGTWEVRGYQTAFYGGPAPYQANHEYYQQESPEIRDTPHPQAPPGYYPREFNFHCELTYVSARRISP